MDSLLISLIPLALSVIFYIAELTSENSDGLRAAIYVLAGPVGCISMGYCTKTNS
jgi:hypothetical protein